MSDVVLRIEKLHVGYLITKGGGSAEFKYAAKTEAQMIDTILEGYGFRVMSLDIEPIGLVIEPRLPPFPLLDDDDTGLNAGTAV